LAGEPVLADCSRLLAFMAEEHPEDRIAIPGDGGLDVGAGKGRPIEVGSHQRAARVEVERIERCALLCRAGAFPEAAANVRANPAVPLAVSLGIPPVEVRLQRLPSNVVRIEAFGAVLNERTFPKPGEQLVRVFDLEDVREEVLGGDACLATNLERGAPVRG